MSRYVLTQEQLDRLQDQIQQLTRLNDAKQERIRELELHKVRVSNTETAGLLRTIGRLENEMSELKRENEQLRKYQNTGSTDFFRIKELEKLLEEERKLRKYYEALTQHVETKCAEESLIRELTTELCQLQKAEIEIDNKRIEELQKKVNTISEEGAKSHRESEKERKHAMNAWSRENFFKNKQLKFITEQLRRELLDLQKDVKNNSAKTNEDHQKLREIQKWMNEAHLLTSDLEDIENLKKDLRYMRSEIENRRKSISKYNT